MGKHKKTLREKIIADNRHLIYSIENNDLALHKAPITIAIDPDSYSYIKKDLLRIGILTFILILSQIILHYLLKNHVIILPFLRY